MHVKSILPTRLLLIGTFFSLLLSCGRKDIPLQIKVPVLGSVAVSDIKSSSAKASTSLKDIGFGAAGSITVSDYGICLATKETPTTADTKLSAGTSVAMPQDFFVSLPGLTPGTKYFVRAYAVYEGGTTYGEQATFTTENLKAPDVTTAEATDLTTTAFSITGKLTSLGTSDVTQYGHVLSATNQTPTTADTKTEMGATNAAPKDFKSVFGSLKPNTIYYVRAYAINVTGTGYSEVKTVKTSADQPPVVTTADATDLTANSFTITGRVASIGTLDVTQFGHCLSETNPSPTTADTKVGTTITFRRIYAGAAPLRYQLSTTAKPIMEPTARSFSATTSRVYSPTQPTTFVLMRPVRPVRVMGR